MLWSRRERKSKLKQKLKDLVLKSIHVSKPKRQMEKTNASADLIDEKYHCSLTVFRRGSLWGVD